MMKDELMHTRGIIEMYQRLVPDTSQTLQAVASRAMAELEAVELQLAAAAQRERELREALEPFAQAANDIANGTAHHFSGGLWFTDMASGLKAIVWTGGAAKHRQLSMVDLQRAARLLASADGMQGNKV